MREITFLLLGITLQACILFIFLERFVPVTFMFSEVSRLESDILHLKECFCFIILA